MKQLFNGAPIAGVAKEDTFARRLRESRDRVQLSVKKLSELSGFSESAIRRIERGQTRMLDKPKTMTSLAKALGVSDVWLYAGGIAGDRCKPEWYAP